MNDRFLLSHAAISDPGFTLAAETAGYRIYENKRWRAPIFSFLPRVPAGNLNEAARAGARPVIPAR